MKIISFDQSTVATGFAIFENGTLTGHGLINFKNRKVPVEERVADMAANIYKLIREMSPDFVVIEDVVLQRSAKTMKDLSELKGRIMGVCQCCGVKCTAFYPAAWRKVLHFCQGQGVKRAELKKQAAELVQEKYGTMTEDECDAVCIGLAYIKSNLGGQENEV